MKALIGFTAGATTATLVLSIPRIIRWIDTRIDTLVTEAFDDRRFDLDDEFRALTDEDYSELTEAGA